MMVLVSWMAELGAYVSREFHYVMQDLIQVYGWRHVRPDAVTRAVFEDADGVLFWETYELSTRWRPLLREAGIPSYFFADDLHLLWAEEGRRAHKAEALANCDAVLSPYAYRFDDFYPELRDSQRVEWVPHAASPDFDVAFEDRPRNKILLSGAGGPHYPLRGRLKDLQEANHPAIEHCDHPGYQCDYDYERDTRVGAGYARRIRQYKAAFTDASVFGYVVAKYFEIPATGALLFADGSVAGPLAKLGFVDGVHYVSATMENIEERIEYVVDPLNEREIYGVRRRGQELVKLHHRTADRARRIHEVCLRKPDTVSGFVTASI